jgi:hypothetical protein
MDMTIEELARFYFQDKLSKFCPADKSERPNGFEKEMFRYGLQHAQADTEKLEAENARLREALEFYAKLGDETYPNTTIIYDEWGKCARKALRGGE